MLKVEGIAFRFVPDPAQIRNALEVRSSDEWIVELLLFRERRVDCLSISVTT